METNFLRHMLTTPWESSPAAGRGLGPGGVLEGRGLEEGERPRARWLIVEYGEGEGSSRKELLGMGIG